MHCGLCLPACPTYLELGGEADSPRGRIHLMRALEDGRLDATPELVRHLDLCLGCRACETACPSGVEYGVLIEAVRAYTMRHRPGPARGMRRALAGVLASPILGAAALAPIGVLGGRRWMARLARVAPGALQPWLAIAAAGPRGGVSPPLPELLEPSGTPRGTAVLFTGCAPARLFPSTHRAAARLLARAGVRVVTPRERVCCGALAAHIGAGDLAERLARETLERLAGVRADWVVTAVAGCGAFLREYGRHLGGDPRAGALAARARDATELLAELGLPPAARPLPRKITIHDPCHLAHGQGVRGAARALLAAIPGVRLLDLEEADTCCGSAGTYNLTERAMARRLLRRKVERIAATGAEIVAAANPGCLLQIRAGLLARGLPVAAEHPLDLLSAAHLVG